MSEIVKNILIAVGVILVVRGGLGIYQDCNYWWHKEFNLQSIMDWLNGFRR